jgi:hypothetical protein
VSGISTARQLEFISKELDTVQMYFLKEESVIADCCFQKSLPERWLIVPTWAQFLCMGARNTVNFCGRQVRDDTCHEGRHPEYQPRGARLSPSTASGFRQNLARERNRLFARKEGNYWVGAYHDFARASAAPPISVFEIQVKKHYGTTTRALTSIGSQLLPQFLEPQDIPPSVVSAQYKRRLGKRLYAAGVKAMRRRQHLQTGPPDLLQLISA